MQQSNQESQENIERVLSRRSENITSKSTSTKIYYENDFKIVKKDKQFIINQWISAINYWASGLVTKSFKMWLRLVQMEIKAEKFKNYKILRRVVTEFGDRVYRIGNKQKLLRVLDVKSLTLQDEYYQFWKKKTTSKLALKAYLIRLKQKVLEKMMERWIAALHLLHNRKLATKLADNFYRFYTITTFTSLWNQRLETTKTKNEFTLQRRLSLLKKTFKRWKEILNLYQKLRQYSLPVGQFNLWLQKTKTMQRVCQYEIQRDFKLKLSLFKTIKFKVMYSIFRKLSLLSMFKSWRHRFLKVIEKKAILPVLVQDSMLGLRNNTSTEIDAANDLIEKNHILPTTLVKDEINLISKADLVEKNIPHDDHEIAENNLQTLEISLNAFIDKSTLALLLDVFHKWQIKYLQNRRNIYIVSESFKEFNLKKVSIKTWLFQSKLIHNLVVKSKQLYLGKIFRHWQNLRLESKVVQLRYNGKLKFCAYLKWRRLLQERRLTVAAKVFTYRQKLLGLKETFDHWSSHSRIISHHLVILSQQAKLLRIKRVVKFAFQSWNNLFQIFRDRQVLAMHFDNFHKLKLVFKYWKSNYEALAKRVLWADLISERRIKTEGYGFLKARFVSVNQFVKIDGVAFRTKSMMFNDWKWKFVQIKKARIFRQMGLLRKAFGYLQFFTNSIKARLTIAFKYKAWRLQRSAFSIFKTKLDGIKEGEILAQSVNIGSLYLRAYGWWALRTSAIFENLERGSQEFSAHQIQSAFRTWIKFNKNTQFRKILADDRSRDLMLTLKFKRWKANFISRLEFKLRMTTIQRQLQTFYKLKKKRVFKVWLDRVKRNQLLSLSENFYEHRLGATSFQKWRSNYKLSNSRRWNLEAFLHSRYIELKSQTFLIWRSRLLASALSKTMIKRSGLNTKRRLFLLWMALLKQRVSARRFQQKVQCNRLGQHFGLTDAGLSKLEPKFEHIKVFYFKQWESRITRSKKLHRVVSNIKLLKIKQQCFKYWNYRVATNYSFFIAKADQYRCFRFFQNWLRGLELNQNREAYAVQYYHGSLLYRLLYQWNQSMDFRKSELILRKSWMKWRSAFHRSMFDEGRKMIFAENWYSKQLLRYVTHSWAQVLEKPKENSNRSTIRSTNILGRNSTFIRLNPKLL